MVLTATQRAAETREVVSVRGCPTTCACNVQICKETAPTQWALVNSCNSSVQENAYLIGPSL